MTATRLVTAFVLSAACAAPALAQTSEAVACETEANRRKANWASSPHSWLETVVELQARDLELSRCRMRASTGTEKLHHGEDFGRVLLTGEGIHPVIGTIAAGNGLAGGAALTHEWAGELRPLRFHADAQARLSANRSWVAGAMVDIVGSSPSLSNSHIHAIADGGYTHVAEVSYFGPGTGSAGDETRFGVNLALGRFSLILPAGGGFALFGQAEGLRASPLASPDSGVPSIEARFSDASAPALGQATTYAVLGGGAGWRYPDDAVLTGYSTTLHAAVRRYQEAAGHPYSFTRSDLTWDNQYTPEAAVDVGTFSARMRLSASAAGSSNRVPFYLMPTLGGADLSGESSLRSYRDYRFRAPHTLAAQFEYAHTVYDPIGMFAFYDVGSVAAQFGDLAHDVKHSVGVGLTFRLGGAVFGQIYYAWGGAEGSRFNFSGNSNPIDIDKAVRSAF
jgi:hypothetical protein